MFKSALSMLAMISIMPTIFIVVLLSNGMLQVSDLPSISDLQGTIDMFANLLNQRLK